MKILQRLTGVALLIASLPLCADDSRVRLLVEDFHDVLLEVMHVEHHAQRAEQLALQVPDVFDTARIAAISLGRTWRTLPPEQQALFIALLSELIVATYADRFDSYSGQQFVTDAVKPVKSGFVVRTRLQREAADDVSLDYFVRDGKVFNVVADGVSDLSLRRADYNSIIKNEGYERLLEHMRDKIAAARSGT